MGIHARRLRGCWEHRQGAKIPYHTISHWQCNDHHDVGPVFGVGTLIKSGFTELSSHLPTISFMYEFSTLPRKWILELQGVMTREQRAQLKEDHADFEMVRRYQDASGRTRVLLDLVEQINYTIYVCFNWTLHQQTSLYIYIYVLKLG